MQAALLVKDQIEGTLMFDNDQLDAHFMQRTWAINLKLILST